MKYGYGLGLYTSSHNGFTYYKHGGGIGGGRSDFSYLPEYGVGYFVQINTGNTEAIRKISSLIREYQTHQLTKIERKISFLKSKNILHPLNGYYQQINPIKNVPYYLPPLLVERIWSEGDTLYNQIPAHFGKIVKYIAVDQGYYHNLLTDRLDFVVVTDPLAGEVLELAGTESGTVTLSSVPGALVFGRIIVFILWGIFIFRAFLLMPFWVLSYRKGKIPGGANVLIRIWPLLPVVLLVAVAALLAAGSLDGKVSLAQSSFISISVMLGTIAFFIAAAFSLAMTISYKKT